MPCGGSTLRSGPRRTAPRSVAACAGWKACSARTAAGARSRGQHRELINKLPFCDFGAVIDPPSADVTAHIVQAFAAEGLAAETACRRGVIWLLKNQDRTAPGSAAGARTTSTAPARSSPPSSRPGSSRASRRSARRSPGSNRYRTKTAAGARTCAPTTTQGVVRQGRVHRLADRVGAARAARGERARQQGDGARPALAGEDPAPGRHLGRALLHRDRLPGDFYLNYPLYRLAFPVSALGRFVGVRGPAPTRRQRQVREGSFLMTEPFPAAHSGGGGRGRGRRA